MSEDIIEEQEYIVCEDCGCTAFNVTDEGDIECTFCGAVHEIVEDEEYDEYEDDEEDDSEYDDE